MIFLKPDYLPIMDWFDSARGEDGMNTVKTTIEYTKYHNKNESDELLFKRAANEVINIQIDGIDVPTDGEIRREIIFIIIVDTWRDLTNNLEHRVLRDGAYETSLPAIRKKFHIQENFIHLMILFLRSHFQKIQLNLQFLVH